MKSTYSSWFKMDYNLSIKEAEQALLKIKASKKNLYEEESMAAFSKIAQAYSLIARCDEVFYYANLSEKLIKNEKISAGYKQVLYGAKSLAYRQKGDYKSAFLEINNAMNLTINSCSFQLSTLPRSLSCKRIKSRLTSSEISSSLSIQSFNSSQSFLIAKPNVFAMS